MVVNTATGVRVYIVVDGEQVETIRFSNVPMVVVRKALELINDAA